MRRRLRGREGGERGLRRGRMALTEDTLVRAGVLVIVYLLPTSLPTAHPDSSHPGQYTRHHQYVLRAILALFCINLNSEGINWKWSQRLSTRVEFSGLRVKRIFVQKYFKTL